MEMFALFGTSYGLVLLVGWAVACALAYVTFRREKLSVAAWALTAVLSLLLGALGSRCYYILVHDMLGYGFYGTFFRAEPYYHAFCGGILGALLAVVLSSLITRASLHRVLEAIALPGLVMIAIARLGETLSDFGWGAITENPLLMHFPLGVLDPMWNEWHFALFNLEALCAVVIAVVLLVNQKRLRDIAFPTALVWWAMTQVFCESFRVETIKWGFVRVQQVQCAIFAAAVLLLFTVRRRRELPRKKLIVSWVVFVACVGIVVFLEFAIDKCPWPTWIDYVAMALVLGTMGWSVQRVLPMSRPERQKGE